MRLRRRGGAAADRVFEIIDAVATVEDAGDAAVLGATSQVLLILMMSALFIRMERRL